MPLQTQKSIRISQQQLDYFHKRQSKIPIFWRRLGGKPDLKDATVLEVGCGYGQLCFDMALSGAKEVVGIDINLKSIESANEYLKTYYPEIKDKINFVNTDVKNYDSQVCFDYIVSENTFEHIINLKEELDEICKRLKVGGKIYTGFGPLYKSPYGGHGRMKMPIPWGHLIFPEPMVIKWVNMHREEKVNSIYELGLNKTALADYKRLFNRTGLSILYFKVNHGDRLMSRIFSWISKIPFLEEYFSHDLYCVLRKDY